MHSDPIADLLTRIRNGYKARAISVDVPHSKIKLEIVKILEQEGYLSGHEVTNETKRVSTPGLRVYKGKDSLRPIRNGLTTRILTTSQGLMTDREARRRHIGGEVICEVN